MIEDNSINLVERIKLIMNHFNLNQSEFAREIGVRQPNLSSILKGERKCGDGVLNKILLSFDINKSWLYTGKGEMLGSNSFQENSGNQVPLIPASAFAGSVNGFSAELITLDNCEFINAPVSGAEMAIQITGDSMEPEYPNGAYAYIRKINEQAFIPWGHTVILDTENGAFIKKIYPDENDDEYIWAKSINPNYPPIHVPKSCVLHIFRVLAVSRIFTTM